ncbi:sialate O-acetylesterase [Bacteroides stercoris]|jgi:sialate O-acetylesterase|uniref:sialate O-acetylesterase n=1 Tax=Bacteroides stercoris TaxID=46506 RepID=UPI000E58D34C|nr:sialate O-acetylesterase [Bacteroides stercoris]RHE88788.1 sialate O-acetylesterase [Bacteroides stercoris]
MKYLIYDKIRLGVAVLLCFCTALQTDAKVKLPALISDGMVLQREQPVKIWGTADAGESVSVTFMKKKYAATADNNGHWSVTLPSMKAGGPYLMRINDIKLNDILIGDVWLCSGQSNMELPVSRVTDMFATEINEYSNERIRQIIIPKVYNFHAPQETLSATSWKPMTQENVMNFSALAYFFAKEMYEKTKVPVGIINSSWGGTPIEAWISEEGLKEFPIYINDKRLYEDDAYCAHIKKLEGESFYRWNLSLYRSDAGLHEKTPWYASNYDDSNWQTVNMFSLTWGNDGLNPIAGSHWLRQNVEIPQTWNNKEVTLRLGCIIDADSVYVNGTFAGTTGYQYPPRIYRIPAGILKPGVNNITVRIISNGGQPEFVQEKPYKLICDDESINLKEEWKYRLGTPMPSAPNMMFFCYKPVCLYNTMIAPLQHYTLRGTVWYQGESNVSRRNEYATLLTAMMADWRRTFSQPELPFYIVELADYLSKEDISGRKAWAEMRLEQAKAAQTTPNAFLIRNNDLGEWNDIHPLDKKTLGRRVANKVLETLPIKK